MKRLMSSALCAALFFLCLTGCVSINFAGPGAVTGRGAPEVFEFNVGQYSAIRIEGFCNVEYYSAPSDIVTLEVQPNLAEYYTVEVINGELVVRTTRRISFTTGNSRAPVLTVSTPVLEGLSLAGAGTFTAYDTITADSFRLSLSGAGTGTARLDVNSLRADISGAGSFKLSGYANDAELTMSGAGELNTLDLITRRANVRLSGAGVISVNAAETLSINASGVGSVRYKGGAETNINRSGVVVVERVD
jgi:hypothetical protein